MGAKPAVWDEAGNCNAIPLTQRLPYNRSMTTTIQARFDGRVLIPEGPIDLPLNQVLTLDIRQPQFIGALPSMEQRRQAHQRLLADAVSGGNLPDLALRRESIYED
jgi:hypothetical protein